MVTITENMIELDGSSLTLSDVERISAGAPVRIRNGIKERIDAARAYVQEIADGPIPVYGVNTGFGYFANERINGEQLDELQENILLSHAGGHGTPLPIEETRLAMVLRLNVLLTGNTGVRYELCEQMMKLIQAEIYPIIPEYGSLGASGDLAPLAHLALPLIGKGKVKYCDQVMDAAEALGKAGITPIKLKEKEGLGLINGTQIMLSVGGLALAEGLHLLAKANQITALSYEATQASLDSLNPLIHESRGQEGQIAVAKAILKELEGSYLHDKDRQRPRVQDSYSLRCVPQVHGPSCDALHYAKKIIETELNASTDNPLVFDKEPCILSGGNFHGQALAMAFDIVAMALAELGNISERRLELLLNPHMSGLPAFLSYDEGLHSGYMILQYLSGSLVNENKLLANPSCTDSIPGNVGIEDHVSMGMTSARKFKRIVNNLKTILVCEMLAAAQAVDLRETKKLGVGTSKTYKKIRNNVPRLMKDRIVSEDVSKGLEVLTTI